jgi:hypothetical protein
VLGAADHSNGLLYCLLAKPPGGRVGVWLRGGLLRTSTVGELAFSAPRGSSASRASRPVERHPASVKVQGRSPLSSVAISS